MRIELDCVHFQAWLLIINKVDSEWKTEMAVNYRWATGLLALLVTERTTTPTDRKHRVWKQIIIQKMYARQIPWCSLKQGTQIKHWSEKTQVKKERSRSNVILLSSLLEQLQNSSTQVRSTTNVSFQFHLIVSSNNQQPRILWKPTSRVPSQRQPGQSSDAPSSDQNLAQHTTKEDLSQIWGQLEGNVQEQGILTS